MKKAYYRIPNPHDVNSRGIPRGVVVADSTPLRNGVNLGLSLCNPTDQFTKVRGSLIAHNRLASDPIFLTEDALRSETPPAGSIFADYKRYRPMWDFVRYIALDEITHNRKRSPAD